MAQQDSVRTLLADLEHRRLGRRDFVQRAGALGLSARATAMLLGTAGVAVPASVMAAAQEQGGTMRFAVTTDPETLDPQVTTNSAAYTVFDMIYSTLIYQDLDLTFQGLLAESWEISDDNLNVTFHLREGITFHDGSPFTADSVRYTFERLQESGSRSPIYEEINKITAMEVVDDRTITLTFSEPSATFMNAISNGYGGILSESAVAEAGDEFGRVASGTNAWTLEDWQTGSLVTLHAFEEFNAAPGYYENRGRPYIDSIEYKVIPEAFTQVASLETGEIDAIELTATDVPRFENDDRFQIFTSRTTGINNLGLNPTRPLTSDVNVRRAIAHAIDRDEIVNTLFEGGLAEPVYTALPPSIQGYSAEIEEMAPHFDLEEAERLLAEAGWERGDDDVLVKDGEQLAPVLYTTTSTANGQIATLVQAQLRKVGIDMTIEQMEIAALLEFAITGEHDIILLGYNWNEPDALYLFLSSDRLESSNQARYSNPEFDELVRQGQRTLDHEERMAIYYDAQKILIEDMPWVPLYMPITKTAVASRIQGVDIFPTGGLLLNDAWVAD